VDSVADFLVALIPSAGVILLFWLAVRSMIQADRRERAAEERIRTQPGQSQQNQSQQNQSQRSDDAAGGGDEIPRPDA
jgi:hypothetical protein